MNKLKMMVILRNLLRPKLHLNNQRNLLHLLKLFHHLKLNLKHHPNLQRFNKAKKSLKKKVNNHLKRSQKNSHLLTKMQILIKQLKKSQLKLLRMNHLAKMIKKSLQSPNKYQMIKSILIFLHPKRMILLSLHPFLLQLWSMRLKRRNPQLSINNLHLLKKSYHKAQARISSLIIANHLLEWQRDKRILMLQLIR